MLVPLVRRNGERIERLPVVALAADQAVAEAAALERRDEQARGLLLGARALAGAKHLREEGHRLEERPAVHGVDVFDRERVVRIAVAVAMLLEQLAQRLPAIAVHRRGHLAAAVVSYEARQIAACAVDALGVIGRHARALLL